MSKTIDEKVVEMRFDNKHFESNVQTTMSTLDKLKAKLNLTGASKGLENVSTAAKKVNMDGLVSGLNTVHSKFSALEVIGVGALLNIGNAAANAGKRLVSSLSGIQAAMSGFNEYSMTMNTVQTLVNSTGKSIKEVEGQLKELDEYADKTVYSTADMFNNIYKFTNAGIDLDTAKTAMIGIANATAYAGQGAQQASIAYYNLAQSMSMGYLTTIDYKSLNLANIATKEFKQRMADAAVAAGTLKKVGDDLYNTGKKEYSLQALFTEGLKDQWATTNVMMDVFKQYGSMETEIGKKAWAAAQEVKTFGMMMESLQAQAGTGWKDTWQILFGGLDDAKRVWTGLSNFISNIIGGISRWRNTILDIAMNNPLKELFDKINNSSAIKTFQELTDKVNKTTKTLEEYQNMIGKIWKGDYKNQPYRKALVEAEGYNYEVTQSLVNLTDEIAGYGKGWTAISKITQEDVVAAEKKYGIYAEQTTETVKEEKKALEELTDERLKAAGLTDDEIYMYRQLEKGAKKYGMTIEELAKKMDEASGRDLLYGSADGKVVGVFQNIGQAITNVFTAIKKGWTDVFEGITGVDLYMIIEKINKFTESIRKVTENEDEMRKLSETFRGLFSIIHIVTTSISSGLKIAFQVLKGILSAFNIDVLDFTSIIGNIIYNFDRWITENNMVVEAVKMLTTWIISVASATKDWITQNEKIMSVVNKIKEAFKSAGDATKAWFEGLKETDNIPEYIFGGLINGIRENGPKVWEAIKDVAIGLVDAIKEVLKIHSPSKVMFAIGGFIIAGLIAGMKDQQLSVLDLLKGFGNKIIEMFKSLDLGNVIAVGIASGIIYTAKRMLDLADKLVAPIKGLTNVLNGLGSALSGVGSAARDFGASMKYQGIAAVIKSIAISIGILVVSLWVLAKLPADQLKQGAIALGVIGLALAAFIGLVAALSGRLSKVKLPDMGKTLAVIVGVSVGMLIMAKALKSVAKIEPDKMISAIFGLIACAAAMAILLLTLGKVTEALKGTKNIEKMGKVFTKMTISMLLIAVALKMMSKVEPSDIWKMVGVMTAMLVLLGGIAALNHFTENSINKSADTIKAVGVALVLLVIAMKLAGGLKTEDFLNGLKVIGVFSALLLAMMGISKLFKGTEMIKVTASILMATIAIGMLAVITKLMGNINPDEMKKGLTCVGVLGAIIMALILISKQSASLHGTTLVGVAMVMAAMGVMVFLLGQLDPEKAKNGIKAVGAISIFMAILLQAAKNFNPGSNAVKTLTTLTVMISLLAVALIGLSFIDQQRLMTIAGSLGAVILSLAAVIASTNKLKVGKGVIKTLATVTLVVAAMAGIVALLSHFTDPHGAIASAGALSLLLVACGAIVIAMSKFKVNAKNAAKGALALTAIAVPLLAFTGVLALLSTIDASKALPNVLALIVLAGAMTGLLAALTAISAIGNIENMALGVLGLTLMAVPLLAFVGILALMQNVERATDNVNALVKLATACTLLLIPLTAIGAIIATGVGALAVGGGILALTLMAVPLLAFVGILALMQGIENATQNVELLTTMMEKLTECLFKLSLVAPLALMADAAIYGLIGAVTTIGILATAVGAIMDKFPQLQDFLNKGLPVLEQIALSIGKIIGNVVAGFMNSVADELPHTGQKLSEFAISAMPFIAIMSTVNDKVMQGVKVLAGSLLLLTGANLLDSIASFISGGESFGRLGTELSKFATSALPFLAVLSSVDPAVLEGSKALAEAILTFTKSNFLDTITGWLNGESDLSSFGSKLAPLGTGISEFVANLGTFKPEQVETIKSACEALKAIAEAAGEIPKHGGIAQAFTGDNDIEKFADKLGPTGSGISEFVKELTKDGTFDQTKIDIVKAGCDALKTIADVAGELPKHGGLAQAFTGDNDISAFAGKLGKVAEGIRGFVWELQKDNVITQDSIAKINAVNNIMWAIADLGKINLGDTSGKLEELGARLGSFGNKITEYVKGINTVSLDDLQSGKEKINKIIEIANTLAAVSSDPIEQLGEKLKNFATDALKKFVDGLNATQPKDDATNAIKTLIDAIIKGMEEKKPDVENGSKAVVETAMTTLKSYDMSGAEEIGKNFVQGFANGINNNLYLARDAGSAVGKQALEAAKQSIDSHSPSKETYKLGTFFDQGFINGIKSLEDKIYSETYGVGDKARLGLGRAIRGVSNLISEGIDDEFTIRPVLDLSDVQSGAAAINGMLGVPSVGVAANLNAISTGMRTYRQNGGDDVISAIDKLGKNLGNTTGDTYNINGITYDNGSEIQEAVSTLVRAARIERRT
jgi:aerobic-type carbon monoxide dehydrogenase small subunit (CoxS/CutS family)